MKLEDHFCTPLQGRTLREAGIVQIGNYSWLYSPSVGGYDISNLRVEALELLAKSHPKSIEWQERVAKGIYSAFSVPELGELLPDMLVHNNLQYELIIIRDSNEEWLCRYCRNNNLLDTHPEISSTCEKNMAETLAAMLIQIIEEEKTTSEKINKRLTE